MQERAIARPADEILPGFGVRWLVAPDWKARDGLCGHARISSHISDDRSRPRSRQPSNG